MTTNAVRLKHICHLGYGDALPKDEESIGDVPVFGSNGQYTTTSESNTRAPVIVIGRKGSYGKVNWSSTEVFASDTTFFVDTRFTKVNLRWLYWSIQTFRLDEGSQEAAVPGLNREWVYEQRAILPDLKEQSFIANYLDRETTHIDTLITEKERMLTLLEEKRAALISQAVTRGLDPDVTLKSPDHLDYDKEFHKQSYRYSKKSGGLTLTPQYKMDSLRLRFIFDTTSGATPSSSIEQYWDGDIYWITPEDLGKLKKRELTDTRRKISIDGYRNSGVELAPADSLVISKRAPIGQVAIVRVDSTCNQGCFLLTRKDFLDERFYYYTLIYLRPFLEILGRGSTFMELSFDELRSIRLPFPDLNTQRNIANHLDHETNRIDLLSKEISNTIELLKERRSALITAAVTGQIDLEEIVA